MSTFSDRIKYLREEKGWSLREVADRACISKSAVYLYEQDKRTPKIKVIEAFADAFNCDIDYLLGKSDIKNRYANALGYDSLYEAWQNKKLPEQLELSEGDLKLLELIKKLPKETRDAYTAKLEEALKTLGLI